MPRGKCWPGTRLSPFLVPVYPLKLFMYRCDLFKHNLTRNCIELFSLGVGLGVHLFGSAVT